MPYVTISVTPGLTAETKRSLLQQSSNAVVESIGAPVSSIRVILNEIPTGHFLSEGRFDEPGVIFVVDLIEGRTNELKEALIGRLTQVGSQVTGVPLNEVRVRLCDFPKSNMGMAGGKSALAAGR